MNDRLEQAGRRKLDEDAGRLAPREQLRRHLTTAPPAFLRGAYRNSAVGVGELLLLLRNREVPAPLLLEIGNQRQWTRYYRVQRALALHPRTPPVLGRSLVGHLFWNELVELSTAPHVNPAVRRLADRSLVERFAGMGLGERTALARRAGRGVIDRWAKGSIQTARKLLPSILRSPLPLGVKLEATAHLTANVGYVLMILLAVLVIPSIWLRQDMAPWLIAAIDLPLFAGSTVSVLAFYFVARREALGSARGFVRWIPFLMAVGIGLSVNNARAVIEALTGRRSAFRRTPKYNLARGEQLATRRYRTTINRDTWIELALAVWFAVGTSAVIAAGLWAAVPFLLLFEIGYAYTALSTLAQATARHGARSSA